jgi:hypothetical protein
LHVEAHSLVRFRAHRGTRDDADDVREVLRVEEHLVDQTADGAWHRGIAARRGVGLFTEQQRAPRRPHHRVERFPVGALRDDARRSGHEVGHRQRRRRAFAHPIEKAAGLRSRLVLRVHVDRVAHVRFLRDHSLLIAIGKNERLGRAAAVGANGRRGDRCEPERSAARKVAVEQGRLARRSRLDDAIIRETRHERETQHRARHLPLPSRHVCPPPVKRQRRLDRVPSGSHSASGAA